jgi:hypothetical protein
MPFQRLTNVVTDGSSYKTALPRGRASTAVKVQTHMIIAFLKYLLFLEAKEQR